MRDMTVTFHFHSENMPAMSHLFHLQPAHSFMCFSGVVQLVGKRSADRNTDVVCLEILLCITLMYRLFTLPGHLVK